MSLDEKPPKDTAPEKGTTINSNIDNMNGMQNMNDMNDMNDMIEVNRSNSRPAQLGIEKIISPRRR